MKIPTPLIDLINLDIIEDIIVSDRLHLIDLGITKKLIKGWIDGKTGSTKLNPSDKKDISRSIQELALPSEINRKLRSIKYLEFWKGSEFRTFLHYGSIVVLQGKIDDAAYNHFLKFFCAVSIFSSHVYEHHWEFGNELLQQFVAEFGTVYKDSLISSNVHNLLHVYDEVCRFGPLDSISTYPYENNLQRLKRLHRTGNKSLEQLVNRLAEIDKVQIDPHSEEREYPSITTTGMSIKIYAQQLERKRLKQTHIPSVTLERSNASKMIDDNSKSQAKAVTNNSNDKIRETKYV
ncbi:uncharacterized protein LOC128724349 [Anopheles nili]|uniref:uncharacterized protein LOC128724349 n=1 Tax=Anopheles nili TaxID=185578 RepID=UPI00237B03ED|nr:uncharacterized protein LOC128724349 [Anopheles nili]